MTTAATVPLAYADAATEVLNKQLSEIRLAAGLDTLSLVDPEGMVWACAGDTDKADIIAPFIAPLHAADNKETTTRLMRQMSCWLPGIKLSTLSWRRLPLLGDEWWIVSTGGSAQGREAALFRAAGYTRRAFSYAG